MKWGRQRVRLHAIFQQSKIGKLFTNAISVFSRFSATCREYIMEKRWVAGPLFAFALISSNVSAQSCKTTDTDRTAVVSALRTLRRRHRR